MLERIMVLFITVLIIATGWALLRRWRQSKLGRLHPDSPLREFITLGRPTVVAFTAPHCEECRRRQAPALEQLRSVLGERITVRTISALDHPELVQQLGILTVPATAVVDATGTLHHLNLGYTSDDKLFKQLSEC